MILDSKPFVPVPAGRIAGGAVLGIVVGALLPIIGVLQISMLVPVLMLGGILAVRMKVWSGWIPAGALLAAGLGSTAYFLGPSVMLMLAVAAVLPALYVMRGVAAKRPFFEQLRGGILAFGAGLVAAMLIAYASFGGGMVAQFVNILRAEYDRMPDAALMPLVEWANSALAIGGATGMPAFTVQMFRAELTGILDLMQQTYAQTLPGTLLSGALLSGVLSVLWGNWTMARQGRATNESFVGMSQWFMPGQIALGAAGLWLAGMLLAYSSYSAGTTVYLTICQLAGAAFAIQALAALDRRMFRSGRSLTRRKVLIGLLAVAGLLMRGLGSLLAYVGAASALFGSRGAIRQWIQRRQDDQSDRDDPDE